MMTFREIHEFLTEKYGKYHHPRYISPDPICIPHQFERKEDIEIAGFFSAALAWGQRPVIIRKLEQLMNMMSNQPYDFMIHASDDEIKQVESFKHRTFNGTDCTYFIQSLRNIYRVHGGLEKVFNTGFQTGGSIKEALMFFRQVFFQEVHPQRTVKHISNVSAGASAKRLNMFLRWMVRDDRKIFDFGLWKQIPSSALYLPLDVHTGNVSRKLGILKRKQNDWKAVEEVTGFLRKLDPDDPVKFDFALFGLGIYEHFYTDSLL